MYFPNNAFYGDPAYSVRDLVKPLDTNHSIFGYLAPVDATERHPGYRGYLHTNDDVVLNPRQQAMYNKDGTWKDVPRVPEDIHDLTHAPPDPWALWGFVCLTSVGIV